MIMMSYGCTVLKCFLDQDRRKVIAYKDNVIQWSNPKKLQILDVRGRLYFLCKVVTVLEH